MNLKKFSVPYDSDERMLYAREYLEDKGFIYTKNVDDCDFVLLPIPVKHNMLEAAKGKPVFYGAGVFDGYDYNKNETFLLKNAYLTAEGAIALYKENSDFALYDADVLITGYGRIAQALHKALQALGSRVTVCSRSQTSRAQAIHNGARHIDFSQLKEKNSYDVVFNTVPHIIFTKNEIEALKPNTLLIDLASFPGGVDTLYAASKGLKLIDGKRLPSRYSKKSAGYLIGETVIQMIKEGLS
ncbi:MAG: NAD(P)-dependent oxidoreductase [Eubacterium sp.]